uniref:DIS3-like exonuclease 2 n=1 Tax=Anopheles farauti TaxID=69004 RepID=A0A182QG38_9DIPT
MNSMSDEEFFRGIREDIIDYTSKMLGDAGSSCDKKRSTKVTTTKSGINDAQLKVEAVPKDNNGEPQAKVPMEFVSLCSESHHEERKGTPAEVATVPDTVEHSKCDEQNDEPPLGSPEHSPKIEPLNKGKKSKEKEKKAAFRKQLEVKAGEAMQAKRAEKKASKNTQRTSANANGDMIDKVAMEMVSLEITSNREQSDSESDDNQSPSNATKKYQAEGKKKGKEPKGNQQQAKQRETTTKGAIGRSVSTSSPHDPPTVSQDPLGALSGKLQDIMVEISNLRKDYFANSSRTSNAPATPETPKKEKKKSTESTRKERLHSTTDDVSLPPEHKLLVQLFMLSSSQRKKYIERQGIELGLLTPHPYKKHVVLVNNRLQPAVEGLMYEAKRYLAETSGPSTQAATAATVTPRKNGEKPATPGRTDSASKSKHESRGTYEQQVNFLLNDGNWRTEDRYDPERTLVGVRNEANEIIQERLESFVAGLVERKVGYMVEGLLRINSRNNMQSFVDDASRIGNIYINSILLRRCAMEGDRVRVFVLSDAQSDDEAEEEETEVGNRSVLPEEDVSMTVKSQNNAGFVVSLLEKRHNRQCVGKFLPAAPGKKHYRMFMPRDMRIPPVRVFKQDWPNALLESRKDTAVESESVQASVPDVTEVLYQAEIIEWQDEVPIGTILKSIGKCGDLEVENESILVEHNLDVTPYGEEILAQLPAVPYCIPDEELARREDLRGECIFTIDPATARDLDDALSCKRLANGNFQIGVHISDVTYFLREGSPLDELVKLRATSIYMVDTVYHMLPKQLCNTCSLLPGEDKLAFSVFWEMDAECTVLSTRFARTVINSCSQLSYEHAQLMLDNPSGKGLDVDQFPEILHGYTVQQLCEIVNTLQSIAVKLRQRRMDDGCLKINQPKLTFRLDPSTGLPTAYGVYQMRTSNELIEDFMLLANTSVAHATHKAFPATSLLRSHMPPAENMMKNLARTLANHGYALSCASSKDIRECMEAIITHAEEPDATRSVLSVLLAKPMMRALYYCSEYATTARQFAHYALAIPMYTHFTSPIRRYADCLVHRVLAAALGIDVTPTRTPEELQCLATICNDKKYNAKVAGEASSMLYFRHWLEAAGEQEVDAAVMSYAAHFIEVVLIHTGIVLKAATKKLSKTATVVFKPIEPTGSCLLVPNDRSIPPLQLTLFTKVRVTIKLVKDVITVCSMLPIVDLKPSAKAPAEISNDNFNKDMKSARVF